MPDSTIKLLTEKTVLGPTDLIPVWDAMEATTKKCKLSAMDNQLFSKAQKPATTSAAGKDVVVVSYDANNNASPQRIPFETLKTEVNSSLPGGDLIDGSVRDSKLAAVSTGPNAYAGISPDKLAAIPASKLESTLNFTGKTITLPSTTTFSDGSITEAAIANDAVTTGKIKNGSVTADKLASSTISPIQMVGGGKELSHAWGAVQVDLFSDKRIELATGSSMALTKTTGFQNRVTVALTGVTHSLKVGDWVSFANVARIPATDTSFDAFAWSPSGAGTAAVQAVHTANLWVNDVVRGEEVNANQLVPGERYVIKTIGDTNWAPAGAADNRAGDVFIASSTSLPAISNVGVAQKVTRFTFGVWPVVSVNGISAFDFETLQTVPGGTLNDFTIRPLRILNSYNVLKAGRIFQGRFRIYWSKPASGSFYPVIPTAQNGKDVALPAGTVTTAPWYVDIVCGDGTVNSDELRFVAFS
jgi:hypothetical protein